MPEMLEDDDHMAMEESNDAYTEDSSEDKIVSSLESHEHGTANKGT